MTIGTIHWNRLNLRNEVLQENARTYEQPPLATINMTLTFHIQDNGLIAIRESDTITRAFLAKDPCGKSMENRWTLFADYDGCQFNVDELKQIISKLEELNGPVAPEINHLP